MVMELRSGSVSGASNGNNDPNVNLIDMVEDIWEVIEKRVALFFVEEQKQRRELLDEMTTMKEENLHLREDIKDLKFLLSTQFEIIKGNTTEGDLNVANGNVVVNNNKIGLSIKQKMESQLSEVRKAFKLRYYDERTTISEECEPIQPTSNPSIDQLSEVRNEFKLRYYNETTITQECEPVQPIENSSIDIATNQDKTTTSLEDSQTQTIPTNQNKTNIQWPTGTTLVVGDSMLGGIEESRLGPKRKVRSFPGATINDMFEYITPLLRKKPSRLIAHVGTNDASFSTAKQIAEDLHKFQTFIQSHLPNCVVIISSPVNRQDDPKKAVTIRNVNVILKNIPGINLIDNSNITTKHLGKRKLHLNLSGSTMLARNFLDKLRSL